MNKGLITRIADIRKLQKALKESDDKIYKLQVEIAHYKAIVMKLLIENEKLEG